MTATHMAIPSAPEGSLARMFARARIPEMMMVPSTIPTAISAPRLTQPVGTPASFTLFWAIGHIPRSAAKVAMLAKI
ncbi:hypothetical protein ACIBBE_24335 [Streptomyces sp. NPDC051644]|uniref:hypothetical protein n=1 Tax=Streptomyces sp. NPDC051644 TaxID=3365666 RepID=UPI0037AFDB72